VNLFKETAEKRGVLPRKDPGVGGVPQTYKSPNIEVYREVD
jgi:hypothetical protein